jgi:hypothetical protein
MSASSQEFASAAAVDRVAVKIVVIENSPSDRMAASISILA